MKTYIVGERYITNQNLNVVCISFDNEKKEACFKFQYDDEFEIHINEENDESILGSELDVAKERAGIMMGYAGGQKIQCRHLDGYGCSWKDIEHPSWSWNKYDYRLKK